jgi:hypothetical protein
LQFSQTGNFTNQQGALQANTNGDDLEFAGPETEFAPENATECAQENQQAAAPSSSEDDDISWSPVGNKAAGTLDLARGSMPLIVLEALVLARIGGILLRRVLTSRN